MAFTKFFSAGYVLFCVPKENQKGRRCPQGMKAPVGLLSCRPVCAANAACSARQGLRYFRGAGGGGLWLPASASCLASPLQTKGCSPLIIPKQLGSIQKIQVASLKDFLCCADLKSLARLNVRATACFHADVNAPAGSQHQQMPFAVTTLPVKK